MTPLDNYGEASQAPKVEQIAGQLSRARAALAQLPQPYVADRTGMPWEHTNQDRMRAIADAEAHIKELETKLAHYQRTTLQHVIDVVSCIPQERDNYSLLREAERYLLALAKIQETLA